MATESKLSGRTGPVVPVAIYTRVSTDNQVGGRFDSCESQLAICRDYIRRHGDLGWVEVANYSDPAVSGSSMDRPGLRALMRQIEAGGVKIILIFKLERMSRNIDEFGPFRSFLKKHGCRLESATEDISEEEPEGRLKNNIMLSVADFERRNTAKKTRIKMHEQAKRGHWNGGAVPYGYAYDKNTQTLQPHPDEAPVVRRVFEQASKLVSLEQIAEALNREGLRTRARLFRRTDGSERTVGQKRFRSDGLRLMIVNPVYRGVIRYAGNEHPGRHAPLVDVNLWEEANAAVKKLTRPPPAQKLDQDKHFHLLKGLAHCGCCGRALVPHASGNRHESGGYYRYYYCSNLVKERVDARCTVRRIAAGSLEGVVIQFLSELGRHPDVIGAAVGSSQTRRQGRMEELKKELGRLDREMSATSVRIRNCVEAIAAGGKQIAEELAEEVALLKDQKQTHSVERQRMTQELAACEGKVLDEQRVRQSVERFGQVLHGLSRDEQKTLVGLFVERIEVRPSRHDEGASRSASVRRLELRLKLNLPRLVDGMGEQMMMPESERPTLLPGMIITAEVALGQQGRANQSLVLTPFRCGDERTLSTLPTGQEIGTEAVASIQNPFIRAKRWQRMLSLDPKLSLRGLAEKEGVVAPTIVQHLKLLKLAPEIQTFVAEQSSAKALRFLSLRRLMRLASLAASEQRKVFHLWKSDVGNLPLLRPSVATAALKTAGRLRQGPRAA